MYEPKENDASVIEFIENVECPRKGKMPINSWKMKKQLGIKQRWGTSIIDLVHSIIDIRVHEGDVHMWFSPRKAKISLYLVRKILIPGNY